MSCAEPVPMRVLHAEPTTARASRRINWELVRRIADHSQGDAGISKTQLSVMCGMKYCSCMRYLRWMELLGLVSVDKRVRLTDRGNWIIKLDRKWADFL